MITDSTRRRLFEASVELQMRINDLAAEYLQDIERPDPRLTEIATLVEELRRLREQLRGMGSDTADILDGKAMKVTAALTRAGRFLALPPPASDPLNN